ncbi:MAG TPA: GNAT family N-acetyltransferase [Burkholderiales bacterium]|nr:GNAT family N-acetyltransferase [Burkholderiales bacterium]
MNPSLTFLPRSHTIAQPQAPAARAEGIAVEVLAGADAFAALAPDWNRLHAEARLASVFNSWIWQFQWWQVYGAGRPLRLLVAREGGQVLGLLALYVQSTRILGMPVRVLRLVGTGGDTNPDDLGPLLERGRAQPVAHELARAALALRDVDVLLLTDLAPDCPFRVAVESGARLAGRGLFATRSERIALIRLPRSWDEYLQSLSGHHRAGMRYKRRKLAREHATRFFAWDDAAGLDRAFERLAELHLRRWAPFGGSESFASVEYLEFHRRVMRACLPRGWLRLYCLEVGGAIAAMMYAYRFRGVVYCVQTGFDPALARLKVGNVLFGHVLEHAIGEGNAAFDFLRGDHDYKDQLATAHRETFAVLAFRATPGGLLYRLRKVWLPRLKARLLRRPPPKLRV